ncbi:hypothetical protein E4U43_005324, partial [Claviceps pusilla]
APSPYVCLVGRKTASLTWKGHRSSRLLPLVKHSLPMVKKPPMSTSLPTQVTLMNPLVRNSFARRSTSFCPSRGSGGIPRASTGYSFIMTAWRLWPAMSVVPLVS